MSAHGMLVIGANAWHVLQRLQNPMINSIAHSLRRNNMASSLTLDSICASSEDIVAREIEGELIIIPLTAGIGDMEDELYTLNATGRAIWSRLDGSRSLSQIAAELCAEYDAPLTDIERDILGLVSELVKRKMLIVV